MDEIKKLLGLQVRLGKITQTQADEKLTKHTEKENAKAKYKADKAKLSKVELQALLDTLTS